MATYPYYATSMQDYATIAGAVTTPTPTGDVLSEPNVRASTYDALAAPINVHVWLDVKNMKVAARVEMRGSPYAYAHIIFGGHTYQSAIVPGGTYNSATVILDVPTGDAIGLMEVRVLTPLGFDGYVDGVMTIILPIPLLPFAVPSPYPPLDGWVTFDKSFGFDTTPYVVNINGIDKDNGDIYQGITVDVGNGLYIPDYISLHRQNAHLRVFAGADVFAPAIDLTYADTVLENIVTLQLSSADRLQIMQSVTYETDIVSGYIRQRLKAKDYINAANAYGNCRILMNDGTTRLLVSKVLTGGFDLYTASRAGVTLMFAGLWDALYHGAQLGWLLDGTLVSYAWRISETGKYSLYFKRSLNDGQAWEIMQTVVEDLEDISGLPILTQNTVTGRIAIGVKFSDNMGLDWH